MDIKIAEEDVKCGFGGFDGVLLVEELFETYSGGLESIYIYVVTEILFLEIIQEADFQNNFFTEKHLFLSKIGTIVSFHLKQNFFRLNLLDLLRWLVLT